MGTAACGEPTIDAVAVWVDGVGDIDGNRTVRIYDAGERNTLPVRPDIPGSGIDLLQVGVDARARGVAVSGTGSTVWVERGSGRRVTLSAAGMGPTAVIAPGFSFTRSGDAIMRRVDIAGSALPQWLFAPLAGPAGLTVHELTPPGPTTLRWSLRHAANAPVLLWAEVGGSPSRVQGRVRAVAYPSDLGEGPSVDELRPLAQGTLTGRGVSIETSRFLMGCPDRLCLAPSGREVFTMVNGPGCDVWRWSWVEAESTDSPTPPERIEVPCPGDDDEVMLAGVLDDDLLIFDDVRRIYLVDLSAGGVSSLPKPPGTLDTHLADFGRVMVVAASDGELLRVDADGLRIISGIQTPCASPHGTVVSPEGTWVVQTCSPLGTTTGLDSQVRRVSVLGVELFDGIPMRPIAVDEDGNALLFSVSEDDEDEVPRGLFVLTDDGQVTRVDQLEPFPGRVMLPEADGERVTGRFSAAGPS